MIEILNQGKYLTFVKDRGYEYVHESDVSIILPVLHMADQTNPMLGFRRETCPTYESKMDEDKPTQVYTVIGGRIDPADDSPHEAAFRELREEAGIIVMNHTIRCEVLNLPICKSSNVRINAYVADILEWTSEVPVGDGTIWEDMSSTEWRGESAMSSVFNDVHIPHDMMLQYLYGLYLLHPQK